ncbi:NAD(P)-dependent alcohol dehydrogenase [Flavobacteriaceae bacterium 3-367]
MKAVVYTHYGPSGVLSLKDVPKPVPKENEVLIKVRAASVNSWDWDLLRGKPFIARLAGGGLFKPLKPILGCDVAGEVEAVGDKANRFRPGDAVLGDISQSGWGAFAEYVCVRESVLTPKPKGVSFELAAALPQAAVMALQGIRDYGKVKAGQKVVINGAGGGVGTFAIQLAKLQGAEVTAVDSAAKLSFMQSLGADHVVDYTQEDFTKTDERYDFILDVVGHHSLFDYRRILSPRGCYRMVGGPTGLIFQSMLLGPFISMVGKKTLGILAHEPNKNMELLLNLVKSGELTPIIERRYPLNEVGRALNHLGEGHVKGKLIIVP